MAKMGFLFGGLGMSGISRTSSGCTGWREWFRPKRKDFRFECPFCGVRHTMDFRLTEEAGKKFIEMRIRFTRRKVEG